jgi:hypothetical protein
MISDVCISLSRKKEDKVKGTGRFHIMKNRYGMDGMTFNVKVDTSTGHLEILEEFDDNSMSFVNPEDELKKQLAKKFFELNQV